MDNVKQKIEAVVLRFENGEISQQEAEFAIAEITTDMPEESHTSNEVKAFVAEEIDKMPISDTEKAYLHEDLAKQ